MEILEKQMTSSWKLEMKICGNCRFCCLIINELKTVEEVKIQSVIEQ